MRSAILEYRRHAVDHGKYTLAGDSDATNAAYDRLQEAFKAVVESSAANELFELYNDIDPWVQSWAATHTLEIDEPKALAKLEQLGRAGIPHVSTDAKYTIEGWKAGTLRFLPR